MSVIIHSDSVDANLLKYIKDIKKTFSSQVELRDLDQRVTAYCQRNLLWLNSTDEHEIFTQNLLDSDNFYFIRDLRNLTYCLSQYPAFIDLIIVFYVDTKPDLDPIYKENIKPTTIFINLESKYRLGMVIDHIETVLRGIQHPQVEDSCQTLPS